MSSEGTKRRSIRIEDDLWLRAKREAATRNEALADVVRRALEDYVEHRD